MSILTLPLSVLVSSSRSAHDQAVLRQTRLKGFCEVRRCARLGHETEDVALVDCLQRGLLVRIACEHHADCIRRELFNSGQQFDAIHARHTHVGDHDRVWTAVGDRNQRFFGAQGRFRAEACVALAGSQAGRSSRRRRIRSVRSRLASFGSEGIAEFTPRIQSICASDLC